MTPVSLIRCPDYEAVHVGDALDRAFTYIGGLSSYVRSGDRVLVKPNLLQGLPPETATTTHPAVLDALLSRLIDLGARPQIGDAPAWGLWRQVVERCGVAEVAHRYGVPLAEFDQPVPVPSVRPEVLPQFMVDRAVRDADAVINVPKLKSHRQLGFTAGVKNLYGCMPGKRKAYYHMARGNRDSDFASLVAAFAYTVAPALTLVDGVVAMEREGPSRGDPRTVGALIASADPAAADAVVAEVIRAPVADRLLLDACRRLRLGSPEMDTIDVRGETVAAMAVPDFRHPLLIGVRFSPGRLARSVWRNFLMTRLGYEAAR